MTFKKAICALLAVALCCVFGGCYSIGSVFSDNSNQFGVEIATDSMYPTFSAGDKIICEKVDDPSELAVGDIITYWTVINGERVMNTHRIQEIYDSGDGLVFATKGDNNTAVDALTVHERDIIGKYLRKSFFG
jgi:signal peptidase